MSPATADGSRRLRAGHRAPKARNPRDAVSLARPADGVAHPRPDTRTVRLSSIRLERSHRASNQVEADVGTEYGREVDRLHDVAIERVHVDLTGFHRGRFSLFFLALRGLRSLRGFRGFRSPATALRCGFGLRGSRGVLLF